MFRRLAESFESGSSNQLSTPHTKYTKEQQIHFDVLPNIIPSATSGLNGFDVAIQSVNANGSTYLQPAVKYPNDIFIKDTSPKLAKQLEQCASNDIDQLIASKNPSAEIGCGWLYSPPIAGSPYPQLSQGFLGNDKGPIDSFDPPTYKKWFFDLQTAKKQMLMDKCKALKTCEDVDSDVYSGVCGFCMDMNQGIPIDGTGKALYPKDSRASCSPESIVRAGSKCPPPPTVNEDGTDSGYDGQGPQPVVDRTCVPVNGRLSSACLHRQVLSAGCNTNGSLAIALQGSSNPDDYIANLRNSDAVKIYNRVANPPMNLDIFTQGKTTTTTALQEVRRIVGNATQNATSAIGAAARDLCLQRGAINNYDACNDLSDTATSPFYIVCLQKIFQKMGGQPAGSMYPSESNITTYNSMGTLGAVKQYLNEIIANMKSKDYNTQRTAMIQLLGISPDKLIVRAPYKQGIEVFWFVAVPGNPSRVAGFLKRTIERDIVQLPNGPSRISQLGGIPYGCMVQLTDIRAPVDTNIVFRSLVDDGYWVAINQPANIDKRVMNMRYANEAGLLADFGIQGASWYGSNTWTPLNGSTPNVTKIYYEDAGGGWQCFLLFPWTTSDKVNVFQPLYYSLTCEVNAPFLTYEVGTQSSQFEELRNPGLFGQFLGLTLPEYHTRTDEQNSVPGKKSYVRINSMNASINMKNIAYQSWKTVTFAVRLQSMPVKETMIGFACSSALYYNLVATPINGSIATISVYHNFGGSPKVVTTTIQLSINKWYLFVVNNRDTGFDLACYNVADMAAGSGVSNTVSINNNGPLYLPNATWNPAPGQNYQTCNVIVGTKGFVGTWSAFFATSSFTYDVAWVHFFDRFSSKDDLIRECKCDWIYTQFPQSYGKY